GRGPPASSGEHLRTLSTFLPVVLLEDLKLVFVPTDLSLFYDFPAVGRSIGLGLLAFAYLLTAALIGALGYTLRRRKDLFFWLATAAVLLSPYLNLVYIGIWIANRYLFLIALCPLAIAATLASERLRPRLALAIAGSYGLFFL